MSDPDAKEDGAFSGVPSLEDRPSSTQDGEASSTPRNSKGWDGKLRVPKSAVLANPEALSDPEYSDEDNVLEGEGISPDEGTLES